MLRTSQTRAEYRVHRKCGNCGTTFIKRSMSHIACSPACAIKLAAAKRERAEAKAAREERKADRARLLELKPLSYWAERAQKVFNKWVRLTALQNGEGCISCGSTTASVWNAGHFKSVGARPDLRFNPDNVHLQCARPCNHDLSGNALKYREALIRKIGQERVDALDFQGPPVKMTREYYQAIEAEYKAKCKELERGHQ